MAGVKQAEIIDSVANWFLVHVGDYIVPLPHPLNQQTHSMVITTHHCAETDQHRRNNKSDYLIDFTYVPGLVKK